MSVSGRAMTLRGDDIDTDQILPSRYLKAITFRGMEAHVFADNREAARLRQRRHAVDDPRFAGASILLVNRNFGCGSSREHAPQGLRRFGFQAIVGVSFGEIFAGNCVSVGMPCVQASDSVVSIMQRINEAAPSTRFTIDLAMLTVSAGNESFPVTLAEGRRRQFLDGTWDPTSVLLGAGDAIEQTLTTLSLAASAT
ncbi:MAG TPA: 3-isopropylmalate dehydratase small subunit [Rhodopila sp.]|uniref:3-isopropylmalate dehydratase small subunit n=1 Tax=Rhodopila sp. TaxID=2480087 RepID=UPI002CF64BE2|nr:3-isopropylmalate dehydratase small subunit [Rhodopila sp.]HVY15277.1 3-isopropylmalate dehydratase small subunit [Rhodopila sp.]